MRKLKLTLRKVLKVFSLLSINGLRRKVRTGEEKFQESRLPREPDKQERSLTSCQIVQMHRISSYCREKRLGGGGGDNTMLKRGTFWKKKSGALWD